MSDHVTMTINGQRLDVPAGISVAAAIARAGEPFRRALDGNHRAPLCGMGVCFECRATVDGEAHCRTCLLLVADGMEVATDG